MTNTHILKAELITALKTAISKATKNLSVSYLLMKNLRFLECTTMLKYQQQSMTPFASARQF